MPLEDFIITVFCWVANIFEQLPEVNPLRSRGFSPALSDAEVITMEIIGKFMGIDGDKGT